MLPFWSFSATVAATLSQMAGKSSLANNNAPCHHHQTFHQLGNSNSPSYPNKLSLNHRHHLLHTSVVSARNAWRKRKVFWRQVLGRQGRCGWQQETTKPLYQSWSSSKLLLSSHPICALSAS